MSERLPSIPPATPEVNSLHAAVSSVKLLLDTLFFPRVNKSLMDRIEELEARVSKLEGS